jgi:outer membrane protein assembly factor BamB
MKCIFRAAPALLAAAALLLAGDLPAQDAAKSGQTSAAQAKTAATPASSEKTAQRNWAYWRGPHYNGISYETGLPDEFNPQGGEGSNVLWKNSEVGGRSSPIVMNGRLYTICPAEHGTPREGEKVVCLDANTGDILWENRFNVWLSDVPAERVGWSSVVGDPATDRVYAQGVCGYFQCIDGKTGETLWDIPMHEFFGLLSTYGGRTNFPVVCDDVVIVSGVVIGWGDQARPNHRFIAFDKMTGDVVWMTGTRDLPDDTTYSAPALGVVNGQKIMVAGAGDGAVWAFQPRTGKPLWHYNISRRGVNTPPILHNGRVYMGQSEENLVGTAMGAVAAIDATKTGDVTQSGRLWHEEEIMIGKSAPVLVDGKLYCVDDGAKLFILDAETGQSLFPRKSLGTVMRSSLLYADGKIYALENNGRWYVLKPDEDQGVEIIGRGRFANEECHASPIAVNGRVYIVTTGAVYCLEDGTKEKGYDEPPAVEEEAPASGDDPAAHVQVIPAELLLRGNEPQTLRVRLFNANGQLIREARPSEIKFGVEGSGNVTSEGVFQPAADAEHQAAVVTAAVGDIKGTARIRMNSELPWKFDFEGLKDLPVTWVGARYRHVIRNVDGSNVAVKVTTIPKGTKSRSWMGRPDLHDYTVQAEVRGAAAGGKQPDIGLIAQGYTLDLQGDHQQLEIRTWDAQRSSPDRPYLRMAKQVDFPWKPDTWYVMKFSASNEGGKAVLQGKVWPKGEKEPAQWAIEMIDVQPQTHGAPGLYGEATYAEIFLDNINVTPNG